MTNWATADLHFHHTGIIGLGERPFANVQEMNEALILNWNDCVKSGDTIYCLGDFSFGSMNKIEGVLRRLNGNICFVRGNHDHKIKGRIKEYFAWVKDYYEIRIDGQKIVMSHYPMMSWNGAHHGSWMLHGHSHGTLRGKRTTTRLDVGTDCHGFRPISFEEIGKIMSTREYSSVDHHDPENQR